MANDNPQATCSLLGPASSASLQQPQPQALNQYYSQYYPQCPKHHSQCDVRVLPGQACDALGPGPYLLLHAAEEAEHVVGHAVP